MRVLSNEDVERVLTMQECIGALEEMYRDYAAGRALMIPRTDNLSPSAKVDAYYAFKVMGGTWPRRHVQALRINSDVVTHPVIAGQPRRVKQPLANERWVGLVLLFSSQTGALLAILPDGVMQRLRVGAANGIALKYLAREDVKTLALIGSGWQAGGQLEAALAIRPFERVRVFSPRRERLDAFVAESRRRYPAIEVIPTHNVDACVDGADVVMAATSSMIRVIEPRWLLPGLHLSCIKSQEVDAELLGRCDRVVVHVAAQPKQYDNIMPGTPNVTSEHRTGWWNSPGSRFSEYPDLAQVVAGHVSGRSRRDDITCFVNNVGLGLQFAAAGALVLERAEAEGLGHELPDEWFSETVHP
jgi:alanine dehydrogenase